MKDHGPLYAFWHPSPAQVPSRMLFVALNALVWVISAICIVLALQWVHKPFAGYLVNERMVLGNLGVGQWTGPMAGLKGPDRIVSANGHAVTSMQDIDSVVETVGVGEPIRYTVERHGKIREVEVRTMRFTWMGLFLTFGITLFSGVVYLTLGFIVYFMKPDTDMTWAFLWASLFLGIYSITAFDVSSTHWGLVHLAIACEAFIPAAFLHLSLVFPEPQRFLARYPFLRFLPYGISLLLFVGIEVYYPDPRFIDFARFVRIFMVLSALGVVITNLVAYLSGTSHIARQRAKVVLFGSCVAFPLPAAGQLLSVYGGSVAGVSIQNNFFALPILMFPAAVSFAIAKHNLFDVDVYIKRAIGYILMTMIVGLSYFSIQTVVRQFVLEPMLGEASEQVYPVLFAVLVVFLFNPLNHAVQDLVDRLFFRKQFNYKETISSVSDALSSLLDQTAIINTLVDTVRNKMFVDTVSVFVPHGSNGKLSLASVGEGREPFLSEGGLKEEWISKEDPLFALISSEKKLVTKYDVAESPAYHEVQEVCGKRFSELGASLALPLTHQNEVRGVLALGYKKSGFFYTREDIELLETLANQSAVALDNARLADQMRREETVRTNLARYLSPQIVDQIIEKDVQVNLGGDRKVVTILFSDIRNFTSITESRPPDQLVAILNEYFTEMAGIIFANQGSLDKYIGDAMVAVFGSLISLENSALSASHAAIQMIQRMPLLNEQWQKQYGFGMEMGIGLNTGEVFLGNIGSPERMEFTVIGDTVNVASRFSGLAKAGQILMTQHTQTALGEALKYKELPPAKVKGKSEELRVYEVACA